MPEAKSVRHLSHFSVDAVALLCLIATASNAGCYHRASVEARRDEEAARLAARNAELKAAELDPQKQKAIWKAEHITFELEWRFGPGFKAALKNRDRATLLGRLRTDFRGRTLGEAAGQLREKANSGITEHHFAPSGSPEADGEQLIAAVLAATEDWTKVESVAMRVLQIEPTGAEHGWRTRILLTQLGVRQDRRVFAESEHTIEWTIVDDAQLDDHPVIDRWTIEKRLEREASPESLFVEATSDASLDLARVPDNWKIDVEKTQQYRFGVAVEDFNRDGRLDIAVAVYDGAIQILEGRESLGFRDVTRELGIVQRTPLTNFLCAWIDYNNDGFPDLLMSDRLYRNDGGRRFVDATRESGLYIHPECMGAAVADYDCDGDLDVYILYQVEWDEDKRGQQGRWVDEDDTGKQNELWRNMDGRFVNVTERAGAGGGKRHTQSAAWFFYDDDHLPDLYVANDFGKNVLLRNKGDGTFEDVSRPSAATGFATSMGVAAGDLNNDGVNELYVSNMFSKMGRRIIGQVEADDYPVGVYEQILGSCAGNRLYTRSAAGEPFVECGEQRGISQVGWAFAPAFADFNNDGLLDIYSTTGFMSFQRTKPDG